MKQFLQIPFFRKELAVFIILFCGGTFLRAELIALDIYRREPFANGNAFGDTGPYEKIVGIARFAVDPSHPRNREIVDLQLAPRNAQGKVEFESDVFILTPKDPAKGNGAIFYDVNNRGNKYALRFFNYGTGNNDPTTSADAGDGFLFRRGYTVVWCGWIGELLAGNNRLLLRPPVAQENGQPIRGMVRFEMVSDSRAATVPLSRREGHGSYNPTPTGEREGVLTVRDDQYGERFPIPHEKWALERQPIPKVNKGVPGTLQQIRIRLGLDRGFQPGAIYELICECEGPIVQGLGFAAVRDLISFLKYEKGELNPFRSEGKPVLGRAYGFGVSQSGRFLRNFLYLGFNVNEANQKVFDGVIPHVAGGGLGFFNHRFAQPTRHNGQHEEHFYPGDYFPFTYGLSENRFHAKKAPLREKDGILRRVAEEDPRFLPKVMHTQSAAEYWHRSGSLVHTDSVGQSDAEIPGNVRVYAFGGTQHGPASDPPNRGIGDNLLNPADYRPFLRALLDAMDNWVDKNMLPPPSVYPRIDKGTLVDWNQKNTGFPIIPGVRYPQVIQEPDWLDFGSQFHKTGIISKEPPQIRGSYVVRVPKSGPDGNDLGTLLPPEVAVPLATYTGWNLRRAEAGADGRLYSLSGSYIPFAKTAAQRKATGDPRQSIEERYGSFAEYQKQFTAVCRDLVQKHLLLDEDARRLVDGREKLRPQFSNGGQ